MQRLRHGKQGYSINMNFLLLFLLYPLNLIWCFFIFIWFIYWKDKVICHTFHTSLFEKGLNILIEMHYVHEHLSAHGSYFFIKKFFLKYTHKLSFVIFSITISFLEHIAQALCSHKKTQSVYSTQCSFWNSRLIESRYA